MYAYVVAARQRMSGVDRFDLPGFASLPARLTSRPSAGKVLCKIFSGALGAPSASRHRLDFIYFLTSQNRCIPVRASDCIPDLRRSFQRIGRQAKTAHVNPFPGLIWHLIDCSPAGAILWKCCASDFSCCAAANKMRLAVKSPCILAAVRCALSGFRGRAEQDRSRSMRRNLHAKEHRRNANGRSSC